YLRGGVWGAWAGGWAFIFPNFLIVAALGALYVHFGGLSPVTAIFYGVSPAVIALILHSCYRLARLGMEDWLQWVIAGVCFVVTVALQAEVALLFIGAGVVGLLYYGAVFAGNRSMASLLAAIPLCGAAAPGRLEPIRGRALSVLLVRLVAPRLVRHRGNAKLQGFVQGAYAAAIGTMLGARVLPGKIAIGDWLTALSGAGCLVALFRWKVSNPLLVAVTAMIGL